MAAVVDLTHDETEKLVQFQNLTGIEEMAYSRDFLTRHNWNVEMVTGSLPLEPSYHLFISGFFHYQAIAVYTNTLTAFMAPHFQCITDSVADVMRFIEHFEGLYGGQHPVFYHGTYSQVLNSAKRELRFLLVYLHDDTSQQSDEFCRGTLCHQSVVDFLNTRLLFWACDTSSSEGHRVSQALKENLLPLFVVCPFLGLLVLRGNRMAVVVRIQMPIGPEDLITRLEQLMTDNEASLAAVRADRQERQLNQTLRDEQDVAYQQSLKTDQEKERKKRQEQEQLVAEQQREKAEQEQFLLTLEERAKMKRELVDQIPAEPDPSDGNVVRIVLKTPNGQRLERRFLRNQSSKFLYFYVLCHDACPDDFQILTNFPRCILHCKPTADVPEPPTLQQLGFGSSQMLFIHDNDA